MPNSTVELGHIRSLERKTRDKFGKELLEIIASAKEQEPQALPPMNRKQKLNNANLARLQLLTAWVYQRATELAIAPSLLAPQKVLEKMVTGDGRSALQGWRDPLLGDDLESLLAGDAKLAVSKTGLALHKD